MCLCSGSLEFLNVNVCMCVCVHCANFKSVCIMNRLTVCVHMFCLHCLLTLLTNY